MADVVVLLAGWCPPTVVDETLSDGAIISALDLINKLHFGEDITLVSGLTDVGIMRVGYRFARNLGWTLFGVTSGKAISKGYPLFEVDHQEIIGDNWGDESESFIAYAKTATCYFINVAGGDQAGREEQMVREANPNASIISIKLERS